MRRLVHRGRPCVVVRAGALDGPRRGGRHVGEPLDDQTTGRSPCTAAGPTYRRWTGLDAGSRSTTKRPAAHPPPDPAAAAGRRLRSCRRRSCRQDIRPGRPAWPLSAALSVIAEDSSFTPKGTLVARVTVTSRVKSTNASYRMDAATAPAAHRRAAAVETSSVVCRPGGTGPGAPPTATGLPG